MKIIIDENDNSYLIEKIIEAVASFIIHYLGGD